MRVSKQVAQLARAQLGSSSEPAGTPLPSGDAVFLPSRPLNEDLFVSTLPLASHPAPKLDPIGPVPLPSGRPPRDYDGSFLGRGQLFYDPATSRLEDIPA